MEAVRASEASGHFYETTRLYVPEGCNLHTRHRENIKSLLTFTFHFYILLSWNLLAFGLYWWNIFGIRFWALFSNVITIFIDSVYCSLYFPPASVSRPGLRPPSLLSNGYRGSFPGSKAQPWRDADHSPPSNAEVKNEAELYLLSLLALAVQ
jgi:hypothetical protein